MKAASNLEHVLRSGAFAVTGELGPPKNGNPEVVREKARLLKGVVDAANITDCQTAIVRMSSLTAGLIALSEGVEPVMQMTCRDRNRIGMQSDLLGASALGLKNLLCITGDHQKFGNHPQSKGVFDMDSIQMLGMVRAMRDEKRFQCGEAIKEAEPRFFLGAAANPFADPFEYRPIRLGKKVAAGADFIQTQIIYNVEKFARFMEMVRDLGLHEKAFILAGVTPPKSLGMARYMKYNVPGLDVPDGILSRLRDAKDQREEGIEIAVDIIRQVREIPGVAGVHIMAIEWEQAVAEIASRAGLLPRPAYQNVVPVLVSEATIEEAVATAKKEVEDALAHEIDRAKAEAQASRDLVAREKERVQSELTGLRKDLAAAREDVRSREAELGRMKEELLKTRQELLERPMTTVSVQPSITPSLGPEGAGETLTPRERRVLKSISAGLDALRKGLGLSEDQFSAIRHFIEAELTIHAEVFPESRAVPTPISRPMESPLPEMAPAQAEAAAPAPPEVSPEDQERRKQVTRLIAKGNVSLQKRAAQEAMEAFDAALALDPGNQKARDGLARAKGLLPAAPQAVPTAGGGIPPCPPELTPEEWQRKWVIRLVARGNVALQKGDMEGARASFEEALRIEPENAKAKKGLAAVESGAAPPPAPSEARPEPLPVSEPPPSQPSAPKPEAMAAKPAPPEPKPAPPSPSPVGVPLAVGELPRESTSLAERAEGVDKGLYLDPASGAIRAVRIGDGPSAITVGGESALPFHLFEGEMPFPPRIAFEVLDSPPEDWPEVLTRHYSDVLADPAAWARKCVNEYGAKAICLSLVSTDPNGRNLSAGEGAKAAKSVLDAIDVPVVLWGCGNAEKDTETLREITSLIGSRKVCLSPLTDANFRNLGATAMALQLPVVAATPIDVNLAKQLNILLQNLGLPLENILMDPSIGAVGYGLEYTYSVMERIRLAALTQQDDKLQVPFVCNLGREVWKAKECKLPSDDVMGDQEKRGILMEAVTAATLLLAGGELLIMRHPTAVSLTETLIKSFM